MRVLQTPVRFHPVVGGVESYVYELGVRLVERGHDVTVVCADTGRGEKRERIGDVEVRRLWSPLSVANTDVTPSLPVQTLQWARWADVVHTHVPTPWSADLSALVGFVTGTPVVLTYHNDIVANDLLHWVAQLYNRTGLQLTLRLADRILLTRSSYLDESNHLGRYAHKATTVSNGVDVDRFQPTDCPVEGQRRLGFAPDRQNLFFLSVLDEYHEYKGLDVLLDAITHLKEERITPPHLVVGGDGPLREQYEEYARNLGLEDHVTFVGYVSGEDLPMAYSAADAFVLPSISADQEGFGLVALEALACETPVVTTDVVGVAAEIPEHDLGAVVPADDSEALATGVERVLDGTPETAAGRALCVDQYAWTESVDELLSVYEAVCEGQP